MTDLSNALNQLQNTLLEEKTVVADTRKRNTILTLVAWLKQVLQSTSNDSSSIDSQLTDLLPTELLLSKLMPEISENNAETTKQNSESERSASSKRFSRLRKNNRYNTVGVSQEELADARLYLQKKLLSENLASNQKSSSLDQEDDLDSDKDSRRKSLNLNLKNEAKIDSLLDNSKRSFSKSIDVIDPEADLLINAHELRNKLPTQSTAKVVFRRNNAPKNTEPQRIYADNDVRRKTLQSDTDDDTQETLANSNGRQMNKFTMRKQKMKRANTIDVPNPDSNQNESSMYDDGINNNRTNILNNQTNASVDNKKASTFQPKTLSDQKYLAFMNKQNKENRISWMNPHRGSASPQGRSNWTNKFGNIKNTFERIESGHSPSPNKKNSFTHAPSSPFIPVPSSKPPQIPNGQLHHHPQLNIVSQKVAAIHNNYSTQHVDPRPSLKSHQSVPLNNNQRDSHVFARTKSIPWNTFSVMDNSTDNLQTSYNPLYVPPKEENVPQYFQSAVTSHSPSRTPNDVLTNSQSFPGYTYTSTDYTRPACVSTFGNNPPSPIRTQIKPDTCYIRYKSTPSPNRAPLPMLGSTRLSNQMKAVDYHSSSEYLSDSFPTPHHGAHPNRIYADNNDNIQSDRASSEAQEFTATSQIMKYPQSQTATVITKSTQRYDQENDQPSQLQAYLLNNVHQTKYEPQYEPQQYEPLPYEEQKYEPQYEPHDTVNLPSQNNEQSSNKFSSFQSMENLSHPQPTYQNPAMKSAYSTHSLQSTNFENNTKKFNDYIAARDDTDKSKPAMVKVNSFGSQYMPPKLDPFNPGVRTFNKKSQNSQSNVIMNNTSNVIRSNTIRHNRPPLVEVKRKQSLPAQNTDFDTFISDQPSPTHNYLPTGVLKKSKSGHTLALLHQFESLEKDVKDSQYVKPTPKSEINSQQVPLKSALKKPTIASVPAVVPAAVPVDPKTVLAPTPKTLPKPIKTINAQTEKNLTKPEENEDITSPGVEKDHIIYPGQTATTVNRVQNYAQTLNAMLNRKSWHVDDNNKNSLEKSSSGSHISVPKGKSIEIEQKEKTVAAYFAGAKSPQGLQRSSSQHSVLSSTSLRASSNENVDLSCRTTEQKSTSSTKTIKSSHHLKILQKQTKSAPLAKSQTMPSISNINLLDESNVDDAFEDLFKSFTNK